MVWKYSESFVWYESGNGVRLIVLDLGLCCGFVLGSRGTHVGCYMVSVETRKGCLFGFGSQQEHHKGGVFLFSWLTSHARVLCVA